MKSLTGAAIEPHPRAVLAGDDPEAVVLDFVNPQAAGRQCEGGPGGRSLVFGYLLGAILFHGVLGREFGYRTGVLILTREPDRLLPF